MMKNNQRCYEKGLTLIEVMISFSLLSLLLMTMATGSVFLQKNSQEQIDRLRHEQNIRHAIIAIEKRIQQSNQQRLAYRSNQSLFVSELYDEKTSQWYPVYLQFDGENPKKTNTWLYFHRNSGTLRVNLKGEHNVLISGIGRIETDEVIPGRLVRITIYCRNTDYQAYTDVRLNWPVEET